MIIENIISINIEGRNIKIKKYNLCFFDSIFHILKANKFKKLYKVFIISILYILYYINNSFHGRIFITFMYNNEAEMAYIHIWRLYDYVDKFVILTSNRTFTNITKNFSFMPFEENIRPYMDKVDIVYFDNICNMKEYPSFDQIWCFEKSQRDYGKTFIEKHYNPTEDDLIIIVDVDEIFTREGIEYVKKNPPRNHYYVKGSMYFPYYYHKVEDLDCVCVV